MASITIRNLDDPLKASLRIRAARNGRSMEEEVRDILRKTLAPEQRPRNHLGEVIRQRFAAVRGVDLPPIERETLRDPPDFSE